MADMTEEDWKLFIKIQERALEKYCEQSLTEFKKITEKTEIAVHERYCLHYQAVRERDKNRSYLFDGLSRSKAHFQLIQLRRAELVGGNSQRRITNGCALLTFRLQHSVL
jgi:hypothetical protein